MLAIFLIANMYEFFDSLTKQNTVSIYPKIPPNSTNSNNLVAYIEQIYSICYFKDTPTICKFEKSTGQILSPTKFGSENQKFEKFYFTCNMALLYSVRLNLGRSIRF